MKRKSLPIIAIASIFVFLAACGGKKESVKTENEKEVLQSNPGNINYEVDIQNSILGWKGTKLTGTHNGTINFANGNIAVDKDQITAGNFIIDMKTIKDLDITEPEDNKNLVDHLSNEDFFDVPKFPTSKFEITGSEKLAQADSAGNNYKIMGNLTIKDVTKNITISTLITMDSTNFSASSKFNIDRTDFGIKFKSKKFFPEVKDKALGDIIEFDLNLIAIRKK